VFFTVPVEATAFVGAVSAFAVFLLVIFVYVNKKWGLVSVGVPPGTHLAKKSHRPVAYRSTKDRPLCVPVITGNNAGPAPPLHSGREDQIVKQCRENAVSALIPESGTGAVYFPIHTTLSMQDGYGMSLPANLVYKQCLISILSVEQHEKMDNYHLLGSNGRDLSSGFKNRPSPNPSIYRDASMELEDEDLDTSEFTPLMPTVIRNGEIYHSSSHHHHNNNNIVSQPTPPQTVYTRQGQVMPAFGTTSTRPMSMISSRSVDTGYGPRSHVVGGYCRPPLLPQRSFDMGSRTSSPCSSTHSHPHFATSRPLRVSSTLPHAPTANPGSRRRAPHSRM